MKVQYNQVLSGSRLASRLAGLGRDDELRHCLLRGEGHVVIVRSEINRRISHFSLDLIGGIGSRPGGRSYRYFIDDGPKAGTEARRSNELK